MGIASSTRYGFLDTLGLESSIYSLPDLSNLIIGELETGIPLSTSSLTVYYPVCVGTALPRA